MRPLLFLAVAAAVSACSVLDAPSKEAQQAVSGAYSDLQTLVETARLGAYAKRSSFDTAAPLYGSTIARMKSAKPSEEQDGPEQDLTRVIDGCISNITDLSELHKTAGLRPTLQYEPFTIACTLADAAIEETF